MILALVALAMPYLPHVDVLGFTPVPLPLLLALVAVTVLYVGAAEATKVWFYRRQASLQA